MNNETIWTIRDARGLSQDEKSLLWAIESRGVAVTRWSRLAEDAGMKKDRFYRTRKSLQAKSLILIVRKYDDVSEYTVNLEALRRYLPVSRSANEHSHTENGHSHSANPPLRMSETKKNMKRNKKVEREEEPYTDSDEPVEDKNSDVREEVEPLPNSESTTAHSSNVDSRDAGVAVEEPLSEWQAQCKEAEKTFAW